MNAQFATAADLNMQRGARAYMGMSHTPDKRAEGDIKSYVEAVNSLASEVLALAETEDQAAVARAQIALYRDEYIRRRHITWDAYSRCMSPMIVGPARFPTEQNRKRLATYDKRLGEFIEWEKRARAAAQQAVLAAHPDAIAAIDAARREAGEDQVIAEMAGVRVVNSPADERVRVFFEAKPDADLIAKLKGESWKWSPRLGCWQRQNTPNGLNSARRLFSAFHAE
ncbi:hypothetical protein VPG91_11660 [Nitrospirillum amazonense]|uniref:hypothetical protein n=1 Tax=Nitrospirillum amazonense TaxID=28077 RepID=UPI002DD4402B|nr:hypothetical protein [Nitrospirillum amazonense]MEC4591646.1 hypothetical protein [Nitrospirillum amazonense]